MTRIANFGAAILLAGLCLSAAVATGASGVGGGLRAVPTEQTVCCIYVIF